MSALANVVGNMRRPFERQRRRGPSGPHFVFVQEPHDARRARITIGGEAHEVEAGNVVYIPAGVPHDYSVLEAPFEFLCMVPNLPDEIEIAEGE